MMIKNNTQLTRAFARLRAVRQQIEDFQNRFSGTELKILTIPLQDEAEELEAEISEYQALCELSLEEAVQGPLKEPILLDNIGELLAKLRIAADFTQEELAIQLGWQQSNLSRFENENYHSQTMAKVVEYASSLGVWLHITPSLTEKLPEVNYGMLALTAKSDIVSTSKKLYGSDWGTNTSDTRLVQREEEIATYHKSIPSREKLEPTYA
jgi:transcriptional regulator with XRE-family HTH domain